MASTRTNIQHVKGLDFQGNPVEQLKTTPDQLSLFQTTLIPGSSSTIELYDAMPKYFSSNKEMEALRRKNGGQFLDTLTRPFVHRDEQYVLTLRPARIPTKTGEEREYYPTKREDLIEQAARKLARSPANGIYLGGDLAVQFSLSELGRELERKGHGMSYRSLMDGIKINNLTHTTLTGKDGKAVVMSPIFPIFMHANREQWEKNPREARCYVKFHPLVTMSVEQLTCRDLDYDAMMRLDRTLSLYLFRRMSHIYVYADYDKPYSIRLTTLVRDSGMIPSVHPSDNLKRIRRTLQEFKDKNVIMYWEEQTTRGLNNRITDVKFSLFPTPDFKDHIIRANQRQQQSRELASKMGISSPNRLPGTD